MEHFADITHQKQSSEVAQIAKEFFYAYCFGIKGEVFPQIFIQFCHVVVHVGQLFVLLSGTLSKAVRFCQGKLLKCSANKGI